MGENKMLLDLHGEALVRRVVRAVLGAGCGRTLVVVGRDADRVRAALSDLPVTFAENPDFASGLASSFRAGLDALPSQAEAALFALGDMPFVTGDMYAAVLRAYRATGAPLVLAHYDGVRAPPHLFHRDLFPRFGRGGDHGPKDLVRELRGEAALVALPAAALRDLDTRQDYEEVLRALPKAGSGGA